MKKQADPGMDEVRAARMEISERYGHNIERMLADHMKQQERFGDRLVTLEKVRGHRKSNRQSGKKHAAVPA